MPETCNITIASELIPPHARIINPDAMTLVPNSYFILPRILFLNFAKGAPIFMRLPLWAILVPALPRMIYDLDMMMKMMLVTRMVTNAIALDDPDVRMIWMEGKRAGNNADVRCWTVMMMLRPVVGMIMHDRKRTRILRMVVRQWSCGQRRCWRKMALRWRFVVLVWLRGGVCLRRWS